MEIEVDADQLPPQALEPQWGYVRGCHRFSNGIREQLRRQGHNSCSIQSAELRFNLLNDHTVCAIPREP
jgi:hypothetical protein